MQSNTKLPRTRLSPEDRRAQLLACALAVFAEHGLARATHSHVAARAGVSVSAVYSYFRTREDLVSATLTEVESRLERLFDHIIEKRLDKVNTLLAIGRSFVETTGSEPDTLKIWLDWSTSIGLDVWPRYFAVHTRVQRKIEDVLGDDLAREAPEVDLHLKTRARMFTSGGHTLALMQCAGIPQFELDEFIKEVVAAVCAPS